jgi:membrane-bound metal-dependent hydrolase YbcI (DUF457 family)
MHLEPHAALGWAIGNFGGADRDLRKWCVIGAILPDIDAVPYIFGVESYSRWHHTFGHNVFLWALFVGFVTFKFRSPRACILSFLSFGSHLLTDAGLSGWPVDLFWPFSRSGYLFPGAVGLEAPINTHLVYYSFLLVGLLAFLYGRTPLEMFSEKLDQLLISVFKAKHLVCSVCQRKCNQRCFQCDGPICFSHATVTKKMVPLCPDCVSSPVALELLR